MHCSEKVGGLKVIIKSQIQTAVVCERWQFKKLLGFETIEGIENCCEIGHFKELSKVYLVDIFSLSLLALLQFVIAHGGISNQEGFAHKDQLLGIIQYTFETSA